MILHLYHLPSIRLPVCVLVNDLWILSLVTSKSGYQAVSFQ